MTHVPQKPRLILASGSAARQVMLRQAGLEFTIESSDLDESAIKTKMQARNCPALDIAKALAVAKARKVAAKYPSSWVIGADQVLTCDHMLFEKAADLAAAKATLQCLQGRVHELQTVVCVVRHDGTRDTVAWQYAETARLWMRPLSAEFIDGYLDRAGRSVLWSVGCYQIEGLGVQLFERIEGNHFTILGLPLLPLLHYLRTAGLLQK